MVSSEMPPVGDQDQQSTDATGFRVIGGKVIEVKKFRDLGGPGDLRTLTADEIDLQRKTAATSYPIEDRPFGGRGSGPRDTWGHGTFLRVDNEYRGND